MYNQSTKIYDFSTKKVILAPSWKIFHMPDFSVHIHVCGILWCQGSNALFAIYTSQISLQKIFKHVLCWLFTDSAFLFCISVFFIGRASKVEMTTLKSIQQIRYLWIQPIPAVWLLCSLSTHLTLSLSVIRFLRYLPIMAMFPLGQDPLKTCWTFGIKFLGMISSLVSYKVFYWAYWGQKVLLKPWPLKHSYE